jgi:hypothetical protein
MDDLVLVLPPQRRLHARHAVVAFVVTVTLALILLRLFFPPALTHLPPEEYRAQAMRYALIERGFATNIARLDAQRSNPNVWNPTYREWLQRQQVHFASLKRKYLHATANPWLPVAADPPQPK